MALTPPLIDVATADLYLPIDIYSEWHNLDTAHKEHHIMNASTYVRGTWSCTDEDFDTPDLSDDAERAVALYAEADRAGNLYSDISGGGSTGGSERGSPITRETLKAGSLEKTTEYSDASSVENIFSNPLKQADDIFLMIGCTVKGKTGVGGAVLLTRV